MSACCIGITAQVYQKTIAATPLPPTWIDQSPLSNRKVIAIYNNGPNIVEIAPNNNQIAFGKGWPIPVNGEPLVLEVAANVKHYGVCAAGLTTDLRVYEMGNDQ